MKTILLLTALIGFTAYSYDDEIEGYTFQGKYQTKKTDRKVANENRDQKKLYTFMEDFNKPEVKREKPTYWEWTDKIE